MSQHKYVDYFNRLRTHQGLQQTIPQRLVSAPTSQVKPCPIKVIPVLGGLHHSYERAD